MAKSNLVIVESPAKAKTIGKYLGPDYQVKASMGHVRDLPKSKIGVDVEHGFVPDYQPIKGKEEVISDLKKAAKQSDKVFLATDPDREGEAISWHLKYLLDLDDAKTRRVTFNEITKKVVQESIAAPRRIDQDLVDAQQARRVLDRIVGYRLSPLLWKKIRRGLSAGRVQSVAMRLVVVPGIVLTLAVLLRDPLGITAEEMPTVVAIFCSPVAVTSAVMVQEMGGDEQLAQQVVAWSSALSMVTIFCFAAGLRAMGVM